ncbi:MAG: cytochrome c [gamma proteobacterium symbiont of Bathyaustriella thionipta]|nr:cytochrome c [gamma proteobacterium symbiont of Bathyaustriella thionipta]
MRIILASLILLLPVSGSTMAADAAKGKTLLEAHCFACHDTSVYSRADHRMQSLQSLNKQVNRCQLSQDLNWFDDDVANVADYLNRNYYHFK